MRRKFLSALPVCALLATASAPALAQTKPRVAAPNAAAQLFASPVYQDALAVWRAPREKGACMACHGPDFLDLARVGVSDADIRRRAIGDGTTEAEATKLVAAVRLQRTVFALPATNPQTFRPFQPGGAVLPGASPIQRDAALGEQLRQQVPQFAGTTRIGTLAQAKAARDALLALNLNTFKIGVPYPVWSADIHRGAAEGTLNDWVTDLASLSRPDKETQWIALQNAYLANPSPLNFWRMYFASVSMTQPFPGLVPRDRRDAGNAAGFAANKFRSVLLAQHLMRAEALGQTNFQGGPIAFSYLASAAPFSNEFRNKPLRSGTSVTAPKYIPNPMWDVGEGARALLEVDRRGDASVDALSSSVLLRDRLRVLGFPNFAVESVAANANRLTAQQELTLVWFMIGQRFDPGLQRINSGNSTASGEYFQAALFFNDYFIHRTFVEALRKVNSASRPEALLPGQSGAFTLKFAYFNRYGRTEPSSWRTPNNDAVPAADKARQIALFKQITANFFRMSLLLAEEAFDKRQVQPGSPLAPEAVEYQRIYDFFRWARLPNLPEDVALIRRVAQKSRTTLTF